MWGMRLLLIGLFSVALSSEALAQSSAPTTPAPAPSTKTDSTATSPPTRADGPVAQPAAAATAKTAPEPEGTTDTAEPKGPRLTGVELQGRAAFELPFGNASGGESISNITAWGVPIQLAAGYKILPKLYVGIFFGGSFLSLGDTVSSGCARANISCSASAYRLGAEVQYAFQPERKLHPWVGYGIAWEWLRVRGTGATSDIRGSFSGLEFAIVSGGLDYRLSDHFSVGPFASFGLTYVNDPRLEWRIYAPRPEVRSLLTDGDAAIHETASVGVRGTFLP